MSKKRDSSKLLIQEPPLQVLPSLAVAIGLNEAIILQQLHYRLQVPGCKEHEGRLWYFHSCEDWQADDFPFWSVPTIRRGLASLRAQGLILAKPLHDDRRNTELFYTISYEALADLPASEGAERSTAIDQDDHPRLINLINPDRSDCIDDLKRDNKERDQEIKEEQAPLLPELSSKEIEGKEKAALYAAYYEILKELDPGSTYSNKGEIGSAITKLHKAGCSPWELKECYRTYKAEPFYHQKHLSLSTIANQLGAWRRQQPSQEDHKAMEEGKQAAQALPIPKWDPNGMLAQALARSAERGDQGGDGPLAFLRERDIFDTGYTGGAQSNEQ